MRSLSPVGSMLAVLLALAGCGDDDVPSVPTDAGPRDAQVRDAARADGGGDDEDGSAPDEDGGAPDDGGTEDDAGPIDGGTLPCTGDEVTLADLSEIRNDRVALAAGASAWLAAWVGRVDTYTELQWTIVPASGDPPAPRSTMLRSLLGGPAAAPRGTGYVVGYYANPEADYEVYALPVGANGAPEAASAWRLTTHPGRDDRLALVASDGGLVAAWNETAPGGASSAFLTRWIDATGTPQGTAHPLATGDEVPLTSVLAPATTGPYAAWSRESGSDSDVVAVPLDARGVSSAGASRIVSAERTAEGSLDLATEDDDAVVVFTAVAGGGQRQVRVRALDRLGTLSTERVVGTGTEPSIARFGGTWAVAYRAPRAGGGADLTLAFLDTTLLPRSTVPLGPATTDGSLVMRATGDGRLAIARVDVEGARTRVLLTRVQCD
ncbi:hypothetical protein [Sandaracinus amylolyticus]|uniref:hypothetical protein n=1 Tax=Sandaracinus amylolyticus TaxID=927083 RepID=UPI001F337CC9|nr:hypothetical protein [Sandaracinus amylolyticus]UJR87050.1 Hypothetical protein I5071_91510 [Sandaracinus amylolyticus]